jgi:hypothetical protein
MIPKEKANEIVNKYLINTPIVCGIDIAKQCALIAVDEIISALEEYGKTTFELQNMESEFRWWQEVKKEIELL